MHFTVLDEEGQTEQNWKHITNTEHEERRRKGLCFRCDEKFSTGHVCKIKQLRIMLMKKQRIRKKRSNGKRFWHNLHWISKAWWS